MYIYVPFKFLSFFLSLLSLSLSFSFFSPLPSSSFFPFPSIFPSFSFPLSLSLSFFFCISNLLLLSKMTYSRTHKVFLLRGQGWGYQLEGMKDELNCSVGEGNTEKLGEWFGHAEASARGNELGQRGRLRLRSGQWSWELWVSKVTSLFHLFFGVFRNTSVWWLWDCLFFG